MLEKQHHQTDMDNNKTHDKGDKGQEKVQER